VITNTFGNIGALYIIYLMYIINFQHQFNTYLLIKNIDNFVK